MAIIVNKTANSPLLCPSQLKEAINNNVVITALCLSVTVNAEIYLTIEFDRSLTSEENGELETLIGNFQCVVITDPNTGTEIEEDAGITISQHSTPIVGDASNINLTGLLTVTTTANNINTANVNVGTIKCKNISGTTITKHTAVYPVGVDQSIITIAVSTNLNANTMPAFGIAIEDILPNEIGLVTCVGMVENVNTAWFADQGALYPGHQGDDLYVGVNGSLLNQQPTTMSTIQKIGTVLSVSSTTGSIFVNFGNEYGLPKLANNKVWMGDAYGNVVETDVYTETEIDNIFQNYSTTNELQNGILDTRYYTETEIDALLSTVNVTDQWVDNTGDSMSGSLTMTGSAQVLAKDGTAISPGYGFASHSNTGIFLESTGGLAFTLNGTMYFEIETNGVLRASGSNVGNYTNKITFDDAIPNKKYVDDAIAAAIPTSGNNSNIGKIVSAYFSFYSTATNRWLMSSAWGTWSNTTHYICPWQMQLITVAYTNYYAHSDTNIEIRSANPNNGYNDTTKTTIEVRHARVHVAHVEGWNCIFEPGEKIGVFLKDMGGNAYAPSVVLYFKIISDNSTNYTENYSGGF